MINGSNHGMKFSVDWAQSGGHMVLPWWNIIARGSGCLKLDPADDVWMNEMFHNVGGPVTTIGIANMELVENAKVMKCEVPVHLFQASQEDQVERLIPRSLGKLAVICASILVALFACILLEEILTVIKLRYASLSQTGIFLTGWASKIHRSPHLT